MKRRIQKSSIKIAQNLKDEIGRMGEKGDSYEDILWKMVRLVKKLKKNIK